jgi:pentatricopeptide repeat protein
VLISLGHEMDLRIIDDLLKELRNREITANKITYNTIIDLLVSVNMMDKAWLYFEDMKDHHLEPDLFTYSTLIKGIKNNDTNSHNLFNIFNLLSKIIREKTVNLNFDEILFNSLLDAWIKFGDLKKAKETMELMEELGITGSGITYGIMIKAYGQARKLDEAFELFYQMKKKNIPPNQITYGQMLDCCVRAENYQKLLQVYELLTEEQIQLNVVICTTLIKGFAIGKDFFRAMQIYNILKSDPNITMNIIAYNSMLHCCIQCKQFEKLYEIFLEIINHCEDSKAQGSRERTEPDLITYSTLIKGLCRSKQMDKVMDIYKQIKEKHMILDEVLFNSILDGFAKTHNLEQAMEIYKDMRMMKIKRSNVTFSILIKLYANAKQVQKALGIFNEMKAENVSPGVIVYTCLIQTCIKNKLIDKAITLFYDMFANNVNPDHVTYNTIVNGCVFAGKLQQACDFLIQSFQSKITLATDIYNNVLRNLLTNKKMNWTTKEQYGSEILNYIKILGLKTNPELFRKVTNMLYKNYNTHTNPIQDNSNSFYSGYPQDQHYHAPPNSQMPQQFPAFPPAQQQIRPEAPMRWNAPEQPVLPYQSRKTSHLPKDSKTIGKGSLNQNAQPFITSPKKKSFTQFYNTKLTSPSLPVHQMGAHHPHTSEAQQNYYTGPAQMQTEAPPGLIQRAQTQQYPASYYYNQFS